MRNALVFMLAAGCAGQPDHATQSSELADTWQKDSAGPAFAAQQVHFKRSLEFDLIGADGASFSGTFEVVDPLVLLTPTNPSDTLWCVPRASFSGDDLDVVTFAPFDPAVCGNTSRGAGTTSPLEGDYHVVTAAQ